MLPEVSALLRATTKRKDLCSRCSFYLTNPDDCTQSKDLEFAIHPMIENLPVSKERESQLQTVTTYNHQLQQLPSLMRSGWPPDISSVPTSLCEQWKVRHNLCDTDNLVFLNNHTVIPSSMRQEYQKCIHEGHMGIDKCKVKAIVCVYWPAMYEAIEQEVRNVQCATSTARETRRSQ